MTEDTLFKKATSLTREFAQKLMGSTFLTPETIHNPFTRKPFGVVAARAVREAAMAKPKAKPDTWTVGSAKELLSSILDGRLITSTFDQIKSALSAKSVELETRVKNGRPVNYLKHKSTPGSVRAAAVDPELSYQNTLRKQLLEALNVSPDPNVSKHWIPGMDFMEGKWNAFFMQLGVTTSSSNSAFSGWGYAVSNGKAYLGATFADAHDKRPLSEIVKDARGVKLILPTEDGTVNSPRIQGMPVLVAMRSMEAEKVHSGLSLNALTKAWGSFEDNENKKAARKASVIGGSDTQVDASEFLHRFVKKPQPLPEPQAAIGNAFGAGFEDDAFDVLPEDEFEDLPEMTGKIEIEERRQLSFRMVGTKPTVYDHDLGELIPEMKLQDMHNDRYELADAKGKPIGYAVKDDASLKFYEADGNPFRPKVAVAKPANANRPKAPAPEENHENSRAMRM